MSDSKLSHPDLVRACLTGDQEAWKEFISRYQKLIGAAILRTARRWGDTSNAILEDLIADTYLKLCDDDFALLRSFQFRSEAETYGYLKIVSTNLTHDHFRRKRTIKYGVEVTIEDIYGAGDPPKPGGPDEVERNVLMKEIEEALIQVTSGPDGERDRTIFWMYYRQGFAAKAIAQSISGGLTTKGIESVIYRLNKAVRAHLTDKAAGVAIARLEKGVSEENPLLEETYEGPGSAPEC